MSGLDGMTIWIPDYLSGTQHFTTTQHGAFLLLMMAMWKAGGWLPNDETRLARTAKLSLAKWRAISPGVMELLLVEGDRVTSARLLRELHKTTNRIQARRDAGYARQHGQKGNGFRQGVLKESQDYAPRDSSINAKPLKVKESGPANAGDVQQQNISTTPGTLDSGLFKKDSCRVAHATPTVQNDPFDSLWSVYPKRKGGSSKKPARQIFMKRLADGVDAEVIIAGAKRFAEQMADANKVGTEFVPMLKTWLNQDRWEESEPSKPAPAVAVNKVFIPENDPRHRVWEKHLMATRGRGPAIVERDAGHVRGSWFDSESPPLANAA